LIPHAEHVVSLIKNNNLDAVPVGESPVHQIGEPNLCCDEIGIAQSQCSHPRALTDSSEFGRSDRPQKGFGKPEFVERRLRSHEE
jgi:hypothetical protein